MSNIIISIIIAGVMALLGIVNIGLLYAADKHIDERVQQAITGFQQQEIERQIEFYDTKEQLAPQSVTPDDRVHRKVLERQLKKLRTR
jgi:hypothetical protein